MTLELVSLETIQELAHHYGYWAVFWGIMLENTGLPIPGETITLVGGYLAGNGDLEYWYVLASAIAGAVLGDNFGYWIGFYGGWPLVVRVGRLFRVEEGRLQEVREQFGKNAGQAVFWGRFIALLRIFAGPLAGIARMPYSSFLLCNLAGAAVWASVTISLSYFVGRLVSLDQLIAWMTKFTLVALVLIVAWVVVPFWWESRSRRQSSEL